MTGAGCLAFSQAPDSPPKFEIADVHVSAKTQNPFGRALPVRGDRYEIKTATMVDLIRFAYGYDPDKILGGPNWLEMDHYDLVAKVPPDTSPETQKLMLQSLLADRFKLVVHKENKPLPTYALTVGKKPQLKESDGTGETGCHPQSSSGAPQQGGGRIMFSDSSGTITTLNISADGTIQYNCRNVTMAAFVEALHGMFGASLGTNPVLDETGLKGAWNFDLRYSMGLIGPMSNNTDRITVVEAVDKQLGLKLEQKPVPTPVMVVDSVNEMPTANPPNLAEVLPPLTVPTEFEVASIKPADTTPTQGPRMMGIRTQPGGRITANNTPLRMLIYRALDATNNDQVVGLPTFADSERFDIIAKAPSTGPSAAALDMDAVSPMIRALLVDRFKMTYHKEERPVTAYSLVSAKPRMKKADPASRSSCKNSPPPPGAPPATRILTCQNVTMAQFADRLQGMTQELVWPIVDATGIEGGWDFTLTFSMAFPAALAGRGGDAPPANAGPSAADPTGGYTVFEAMEKELGLKLEMQKRPMPVFVIDHIEQKPTDN